MANIRIDLPSTPVDGQSLTFKAPCDCTSVTGIVVYYPDGESTTSKVFTFRDAHCNDLTNLGGLFAAGAYVKVIIDTVGSYAYIQNADINKYIADMINARARIATGSYVGTGTYGKDNPCTLTFDFKPIMVFIYTSNMGWLFGSDGDTEVTHTLMALHGAESAQRHSSISAGYRGDVFDHFTWGDTSFSWYSYINSEVEDGTVQLNAEGATYHYLAIGI